MITLFNGESYLEGEINTMASSDDFYYGHLGKHALSSSVLRNIFDDPDKQLQYLKGKGGNTEALMLGKLTHWCWLEPDVFYRQIYTDLRGNTNAYKELVAQHGEENIFKEKHRNIAEWLCRRLDNNEEIREIRKDAEVEVPSVKMIDDVPVRGKADMIKDDIIYDLKTGIVSPQQFEWKIDAMNYDLQAWIYMQLFPNAKNFIFIYINKHTRAPGIIEMSEKAIERGGEKYKVAVDAYFKIFHNKEIDEIEFLLDQYVYHGTAR